MITAVAAIAIGVWDSTQTRKHNRLSVAPYLVVDYTISKTADGTTFFVTLSNEGVGPAIMRSMEIRLPEAMGGTTASEWGPVVERLRALGITVPSYWNYGSGEALGVQKSREVFRAVLPASDKDDVLLQQLGDMQVNIRYRSIYGDPAEAKLNE